MNAGEARIHVQRVLGVKADGALGPLSRAAFERLAGAAAASEWPPVADNPPDVADGTGPWPRDEQAALIDFYGQPGTNLTTIPTVYPLDYYGQAVHRITCHERVAESLVAIFADILKHYGGLARVREARMDRWGGCFNKRRKTGGGTWSLHAFGAAVDLDPDQNGWKVRRPPATMPEAVVEIFEARGWVSGGRRWGHDWMHFQATR